MDYQLTRNRSAGQYLRPTGKNANTAILDIYGLVRTARNTVEMRLSGDFTELPSDQHQASFGFSI